MKKIIFFSFFLFLVNFNFGQDAEIRVEKVEPPFWWVGMSNQNLQILIYGNEVSLASVEINYPGVEVRNVRKVENPNYLFIDLVVTKDAAAGEFPIKFKVGNKLLPPYIYELKERNPGSSSRQGFNPSDVVYLLMPDRFANGNPDNDNVGGMKEGMDRNNPDGRHGGDIKGISDHLDYLSDLGVTALWINPLVENDNPKYSYHGYAITDFYKIDPRFGSNQEYVDLINSCHQKGLKVIMDVVFNHASIHHWLMEDLPDESWINQSPEFTKSNFRASTIMDPYASEFDKIKMLTGWFDVHMADLNQGNELLKTYLIQNTIWWIEYSGIDGIRVDTQPYSFKEFISEWGSHVLKEYPEFNIVGEAWLQKEAFTAYFQKDAINRDGYNSNLPSVTDFPLYFAIGKAFNERTGWIEGLSRLYYVLAQDFIYPNAAVNLAFLDNHDLNRYYSSMGEDLKKWKMGVSFLLTTKRIPMIYYGTEILMTGEEHVGHGAIREDFPGGWMEDERNAFTSEGRTAEEDEAFNYMKDLLNWRKKRKVIQDGNLKHYVPDNDTYVYFRYNSNESVMVAFNNSENEVKALKTDRFMENLIGYNYAVNAITGEIIKYLDAITLPPKSVLILDLKK